MSVIRKIISLVLVIAILFCIAAPSAFAATEYKSIPVNIFDQYLTWLYKNSNNVWHENSPFPAWGKFIKGINAVLNHDVCEKSYDGYHATTETLFVDEAVGWDDYGRYCLLQCSYCDKWFRCYSSDLMAAYDEYVATLDDTTANKGITVTGFSATNVSSEGFRDFNPLNEVDGFSTVQLMKSLGVAEKFIVVEVEKDFLYGYYFNSAGALRTGYFKNPIGVENASLFGVYNVSDVKISNSQYVYYESGGRAYQIRLYYNKSYAEAWSGFLTGECYAFDWDSMERFDYSKLFKKSSTSVTWNDRHVYLTSDVSSSFNLVSGNIGGTILFNTVHTVTQPTGADATTRPASFMQTINNYNIENNYIDNSVVNYYIGSVDDSGAVSEVYKPNIYDENTMVFTEPVSGTQILTKGWTYDYLTRSYDMTVSDGAFTIGDIAVTRIVCTYGDENVNIKYYAADGSVSQSDDYAYVAVAVDDCTLHGHSYTYETVKEATCSAGGERKYTCRRCGNEYAEDTEKIDHVYAVIETTDATCTAVGEKLYSCTFCGNKYIETTPKTEHVRKVIESVAPEYDEDGNILFYGYTLFECSNCSEQYIEGEMPDIAEAGWFKWLGTQLRKLGSALVSGLSDGFEYLSGTVIKSVTDWSLGLVEWLFGLVDGNLLNTWYSWFTEDNPYFKDEFKTDETEVDSIWA